MPDAQPLADRYGRRGTGRSKWLAVVLGVLVVLLVAALAVAGYRALGGQPVEAEHTAFSVLDPQRVRVDFTVTRQEPQRAVDCVITARGRNGAETGRREVYVPPGPDTVSSSAVLRTGQPAVAVEVYGCTYDVPEYLVPGEPPSG